MIRHVYANRSNIGDWLSARGIQALLGARDITDHFCDAPFVEETLAVLAATTEDDLIVIGGGGLLMDYFEPFWRALAEAPPRAPLFLWGVGLCDLKAEASKPPRALLRQIAKIADLCVVRDLGTWDHIALPHLPPPVLCPSLAAVGAETPGRGILHVDNYTTVGAAAFDRMDSEARRFAGATGRPYRRTNNRLERVDEAALQQVLDLYRASDLVLSSALHGCLVALAMGRPVLAVSGDWKIEGFMQAVGLGEWVIDATEVERVAELLPELPRQIVPWDRVAAAVEDNRRVAAAILASRGPSIVEAPLLPTP